MNIGIDEETKLVYESTSSYGYPLWPSPILLQVVIASEEDKLFEGAKYRQLMPNSLLFREDAYDSTSRTRRGRMYKAGESQPQEWYVYPHPAIAKEVDCAAQSSGTLKKRLNTFQSIRLQPWLKNQQIQRPLFILGSETNITIWTLVNLETSATGDELVVLHARKSIGALPHLDREKVLTDGGSSALSMIEKLEEDLFRAGPESVVDRAREAATAILSIYLQTTGAVEPGKDLGKLANHMADSGFDIVANAARIIARLHARGKHAEQEKRPIRVISEQDAQFAVQAVGAILCDLGWAQW